MKSQEQSTAPANIFVGRTAEYETFKRVLKEVSVPATLPSPTEVDWQLDDTDDASDTSDLPHIFLISGHGGLGKSRFMERLHQLAARAAAGVCRTAAVIRWEEGSRFTASGHVDALAALNFLATKLAALGELTAYPAAHSNPSTHASNVQNQSGAVAVGSDINQTHIATANNVYINNDTATSDERVRQRQEKLTQQRTALAADLRRLSEAQPLIIYLDTYELVDAADEELRPLYLASGPRVIWVIAGRFDLAPDRAGSEVASPFRGYNGAGFGAKLHNFALTSLGVADIRNYFARLGREIGDQLAETFFAVTRGNPLALSIAAQMYLAGQPIAHIIAAQDSPLLRTLANSAAAQGDDELAYQMISRLLFYCTSEADRKLLYALALARRPSVEVLEAMTGTTGSLRLLLEDLATRYDFVFVRERRLHDTVQHFLRAHLASERDGGVDKRIVAELNERASAAVLAGLRERERELGSTDLSELTWDEEWSERLLDYLHHRLWRDAEVGSYDALVAVCTAYGYDSDLNPHDIRSLVVDTLPNYQHKVSWWGKALEPGEFGARQGGYWIVGEKTEALLDVLAQFEGKDRDVAWHPVPAEAVGEAYAAMCWRLGRLWDPNEEESGGKVYDDETKEAEALAEAVRWYKDGIAHSTRVGELNSSAAYALLAAGDYKEAITAYNRVIRAEPTNAWFYQCRAAAHYALRSYQAAAADYAQALARGHDVANPARDGQLLYALACTYARLERSAYALATLTRAVAINTGYARSAGRDEAFAMLRERDAEFDTAMTAKLEEWGANAPEDTVLLPILREHFKLAQTELQQQASQTQDGYTVRVMHVAQEDGIVKVGCFITVVGDESLDVRAELRGRHNYQWQGASYQRPLGVNQSVVVQRFTRLDEDGGGDAELSLQLSILRHLANGRTRSKPVAEQFRFNLRLAGSETSDAE